MIHAIEYILKNFQSPALNIPIKHAQLTTRLQRIPSHNTKYRRVNVWISSCEPTDDCCWASCCGKPLPLWLTGICWGVSQQHSPSGKGSKFSLKIKRYSIKNEHEVIMGWTKIYTLTQKLTRNWWKRCFKIFK